MNKYFSLLALLAAFVCSAQSRLTVVRAGDRSPIAGAAVLCDGKTLARTSAQGTAVFKTKCRTVTVRSSGYYDDDIVVDKVMEVSLAKTEAQTQGIQGIVIEDKSDPRALALLQKVREHFANNSPQSLDSYSFRSYEKISLDFDEDSVRAYNNMLNKRLDSLQGMPRTAQTKEQRKDSIESLNVMKLMGQSKLFLWERASEFLYSKKYGEKVNILDNRISGLQHPVYELLALRSNRNRMPREIREENVALYRYFITDTVVVEGRRSYVIRFRQVDHTRPLQRRKYNGYMYIDADTYGLKKIESNSKVKSEGSITSIWTPVDGKWFLRKENLKIRMGQTRFDKEKTEEKDGNNKNGNKQKFGSYVYMLADYFDFTTNTAPDKKDFSGYTLTVKNADGSLLDSLRTDPLTEREEMTYEKIDSVGQKYKLDQKLNVFSGFLRGKIRVGIVDFDALKAFKYNRYEGLRLGAGVKLNEKFNRYISPDAYVAYGFKDHTWKYGAGLDVKTTLDRTSFFRAEYYNDVDAAGRFSQDLWNTRMEIMNAGIDLHNIRFYSYKGFRVSYETDLTNAFTVRASVRKDTEEARFMYNYNNLGTQFENMAAKITLKYSPFSRNMMTPTGKVSISQEYPDFYFNYEQGLQTAGGELSYSRFDFLAQHQFKTKAGVTGVRIFTGLLTGEAPIWHHFAANGLGSDRNTLNLNFTSYLGFATMEGGKFYTDKFVGFYAAQRIPFYFRTFGKTTSSFNMVYKGLVGDMKDRTAHQFTYSVPDRLYQEAGLEINSVLGSPFDLGFFYRMGHYATPTFKENFAIQLKLTLLGF